MNGETKMKRTNLWILFLLSIAVLSACASTGPFEISGHLLDAETGETLSHGRIILCPMNADGTSCTISVGLTSSLGDNEDGMFHFNNVMAGKFAVLYAADDSLKPEWDFLLVRFDSSEQLVPAGFVYGAAWDINFDSTITQFALTPPMALSLMNSLNVESLNTCAITIPFESDAEGNRRYSGMNGYIHVPDMQLSVIIKDGEPLTVDFSANTSFDVQIWDTTRECNHAGMQAFEPLPVSE
jgi:hypothetical protein